jgi:hypothetical protein
MGLESDAAWNGLELAKLTPKRHCQEKAQIVNGANL